MFIAIPLVIEYCDINTISNVSRVCNSWLTYLHRITHITSRWYIYNNLRTFHKYIGEAFLRLDTTISKGNILTLSSPMEFMISIIYAISPNDRLRIWSKTNNPRYISAIYSMHPKWMTEHDHKHIIKIMLLHYLVCSNCISGGTCWLHPDLIEKCRSYRTYFSDISKIISHNIRTILKTDDYDLWDRYYQLYNVDYRQYSEYISNSYKMMLFLYRKYGLIYPDHAIMLIPYLETIYMAEVYENIPNIYILRGPKRVYMNWIMLKKPPLQDIIKWLLMKSSPLLDLGYILEIYNQKYVRVEVRYNPEPRKLIYYLGYIQNKSRVWKYIELNKN